MACLLLDAVRAQVKASATRAEIAGILPVLNAGEQFYHRLATIKQHRHDDMDVVVARSAPTGLMTQGLLGLLVSNATRSVSRTLRTSWRYLPLKAILAASPSTEASISPWLSPISSARADHELTGRQLLTRLHLQPHDAAAVAGED